MIERAGYYRTCQLHSGQRGKSVVHHPHVSKEVWTKTEEELFGRYT